MPSKSAFGPYRVTADTVKRPPILRFKPRYRVPAAVHDNVRRVERADQELRQMVLAPIEARRLLEDALTRNAYGTASIEGNPLSLEDVQSLLAQGPTPESLAKPEEREILNYAAFIDDLPSRKPPTTVKDVLALHAGLFRGVLPDAGRLKQRQNFIATRPTLKVTYIPAAPHRVVPELQNALDWLHNADENPLIRAIVFFHEFESIHPFRDGNGRAGRALTTQILHHFGYPGVRYALVDFEFNKDREPYYENLSLVERNGFDYSTWIAYMADVLRRTFEGAVERFRFRQAMPTALNGRQRDLASWFWRLNSGARERRVKFHDVHAAHPTIPERTLKRDLATLRDAGILESEGERKATTYRLSPTPDRRPRRD